MQVTFSRKGVLAIVAAMFGASFVGRSESRLVKAARGRDSEAFTALVRHYSPALKRFVTRRVPERECEDILQDTWIAAWESITSFDDNSKLRTWLYSICYHKIQDHWRRQHRLPSEADSFDSEALATYMPSGFAQVELRESLRDFWDACTLDQQELLRLYYADGLNLREISEVLPRNLNTVKYQFYRIHDEAVRLLGAALDDMPLPEAK